MTSRIFDRTAADFKLPERAMWLQDLNARQQAAGTAVAALPLTRFDGKWKWKRVDLDGPCGNADLPYRRDGF